jgi:8-oxo-dGTP pyrophosphatase MutT (NUDIX family)
MTFSQFYNTQKRSKEGFWGKKGAGVLIYCSATKRFLLGLRSSTVDEPNTWGLFGGAVDENENSNRAAIRELEEEIGYTGEVILRTLDIFRKGDFAFHNFLGIVPQEFKPNLDWENKTAKWFLLKDFPENLHFGLKRLVPLLKDRVVKESVNGLFTESVDMDLDKAYLVFKKEYEQKTGKSWDKDHFKSRAANWEFYGDDNGYIALRPQHSGFYKLVASAGSNKSKLKAFLEIKSKSLPVWGLVTKDIASMLMKLGYKQPNFLERKILMSKIPKSVLGNSEIVETLSDGGIVINQSGGIGNTVKYFIGSPEYWKKTYQSILK